MIFPSVSLQVKVYFCIVWSLNFVHNTIRIIYYIFHIIITILHNTIIENISKPISCDILIIL